MAFRPRLTTGLAFVISGRTGVERDDGELVRSTLMLGISVYFASNGPQKGELYYVSPFTWLGNVRCYRRVRRLLFGNPSYINAIRVIGITQMGFVVFFGALSRLREFIVTLLI